MLGESTTENSLAISDSLLSRLVLQPHDDPMQDICAYYAAANLFALSGHEPPPVSKMVEFMKGLGEHKEWQGLTEANVIQLLQAFGFPRQLGVACLLPTVGMCGFIQAGLERGFSYLLTYCWVTELTLDGAMSLTGDPDFAGIKVWITHSMIPLSVDVESREMDCLTGWETKPVATIKVQEIMLPDWFWCGYGMQPVGFARDVLMIWPEIGGRKGN
jgi:hypothetical protein